MVSLKTLLAPPTNNGFYRLGDQFQLGDDGYFVFGSNLQGIHGAGAAKTAHRLYEAQYGIGVGFTGFAYAIPTRQLIRGTRHEMETLPLAAIQNHIRDFVMVSQHEENRWFYVTPIGTGHAGYTDALIAPAFQGCQNCWLPDVWEPYLK